MPFDNPNAIAHGCHLTLTTGGRVLVQSRNTGNFRQDGIYAGKGPFTVVRSTGQKDRVIVNSRRGDQPSLPVFWEWFILGTPTDFTTDDPEPDVIDLPQTVDCTVRVTLGSLGQYDPNDATFGGTPPNELLPGNSLLHLVLFISFDYGATETEIHDGSIQLNQTVTFSDAYELTDDGLGARTPIIVTARVYTDASRAVEILSGVLYLNA